MRTTVTIADDVRVEMERMRAEQGIGPSEALSTLARRGMMRSSASPITLPAPVAMGARLNLANIGEALEILDPQELRSWSSMLMHSTPPMRRRPGGFARFPEVA